MIKLFPNMKVFIELGPLTITWYAVFIVTGAYIAYYLSLKNLKKMGFSVEDVDNLFFGALFSGIIGARLWYVLFFDLGYYLSDPINIIRFSEGGMAIHGGLFAGIGYGYYFVKKRGYNFMHWADAIVPNILIAQALGRWGNFMNQEAFGGIVSESHFRFLPTFIKNQMFINGAYRAPTFLYESILNIIGWILIIQILKKSKRLKRGDLTFAYLMWYGAIRFVIEGFRTDALPLNLGFVELRIAQVISVIFVLIGFMGFIGMFKRFYPTEKPVLIFDFDGTIMDTQALILETFRQVFEKHKPEYTLTDEDYYSFLGPTLYDSFGRFFDASEVENLVSEYRAINLELHDDFVKPMDHVVEVLEDLKAKGYQMSIMSSKLQAPILYALEMTEMSHLFEVVYGLDNYEKIKPDPQGIIQLMEENHYDRSSFIYLGDTVTDIEAGKRAGAFTIGYIFDKNREQALRDSKPNVLIDDWRELTKILEGDHEWTYNMI